ncbi:MAG: SpoIVB peptidase S55 domain-containing protein [Acidobacteriota bacterium]|nr:hypothetical protein [Blastocatellia bacterium]MDW8413746.1 SpoIVB peptidase S55 domain-containing protein [Acidobacteriota bacterium]
MPFLVFLLLFCSLTYAVDNPSFFSVDAVRPGMKGVGKTTFSSNFVEEFEVEVLGVLQGVPAPNRSLVVVRLKGEAVERSGVFAGMSGSPVFIEGKLLGAIAYAFTFAKEPIGAVTPIADTLQVLESEQKQVDECQEDISFKELLAVASGQQAELRPPTGLRQILIEDHSNPQLLPFVGQTLTPIASALVASGIDTAAMQYFSRHFQALGLVPVIVNGTATSSGTLAPYDEQTLTPGKSIALELVRGDYGLSIQGTVTWRDGNKIYAFGHPMFPPGGIGTSCIPMSEAEVVTVVPSMFNSFKLGVAKRLVGAVHQDRSAGICGKLGELPRMIPVKISVASRGRRQVYNMEMIDDRQLTPILMQIVTLNSIVATERSFGDLTIWLQGRIKLKGQPDINFSNRFSANNAFISAVLYSSYPIAVLYGSGFSFEAESIELELKAEDSRSVGFLTAITVDRTEVRRGETLTVNAFAQNDRGETLYERVTIGVPQDAPLGKLMLTVGDGQMMATLDRRSIIDSNPKELSALIAAMNRLPRNDRLYVKLYRTAGGAVIKNKAMPALPASMLAALDSSRSSNNYLPLPISTVAEYELPPSKFLISGQQTIQITVIP